MPREGDAIAQDVYITLRRNGWRVSPVIDVALDDVRLVGIDPVTSPTGLGMLSGGIAPGDMLRDGAPLLFATAETAARIPARTSARADLRIDPAIAPGVAIGDLGAVQRLSGRDDLSRLMVLPEQPRARPPLAQIAPGLRLQPSQQVADVAQLTDSFHLNLTAFGLLSFAVGLFIVHSTIGLAFEQRRAMIRTLRALGMPLRSLMLLITAEMLLLALVGAGAGIALGYLIAGVLLPDVAATLQGLYDARISGTLALRPEWWLSGLALTLLGTGAALAGRLWQVARMPVLAAVRPRAWSMASAARGPMLTAASATLLAAAAALALIGEGLIAGFALLGCLLIGAALALPVLAGAALRGAEARARAPLWSWFWADTRQQLPGLSLALMALLLAVSANIGVSTMVSSFRLTFTGFLDQRLAPELYVQADSADQGAALAAFLQERGNEVLPLLSTRTTVAGQPTRLFGVRVGPTYRQNWAFLDAAQDPWDSVAAGRAVVVNEQLARRGGLWVGDRVAITPDLALPIAAVVGDYGNPQGQVVLDEELFRTLHPDIRATQFGIRTDDIDALRQAITTRTGIPENAMTNQAALKSMSIDVFERTFTVTAALNVLTLGVAGFAILMSLLTLADLRLPQLAPVWALGLTRRRLGWLELWRALVLAGIVFLCALPLGLALAWVLLTIVNVEAFGWQLPMFLFPLDYAMLGAYAGLAAMLAAAWPALRLMRMPPSRLLKVFANER